MYRLCGDNFPQMAHQKRFIERKYRQELKEMRRERERQERESDDDGDDSRNLQDAQPQQDEVSPDSLPNPYVKLICPEKVPSDMTSTILSCKRALWENHIRACITLSNAPQRVRVCLTGFEAQLTPADPY
ncbi:hypothetical protein P4O66_001554 [Electrophorus voltai]|uniref:Uncharacterized protein n=1 Tax=Electrophorus voltai TaxID=2609070 RepID=A0AAD8Z693_9TELE|nr:hypothetical protein P4O66_001554 [Electrophorus voltai]